MTDLTDTPEQHAAELERFPLRKAIQCVSATLFADRLECVYRCPNCQHETTLEKFDAAGADDGCVFCPQCSEELIL